MTGVGRAATVAGGLVLSMVLAGCASSGSADGTDGSATSSVNSSASLERSGVEIANPKDAAALDPCDLLPEGAAESLGLKTQGQKQSNIFGSSLPDLCDWESPNGGERHVSLSAIDGRSIEKYYKNRSKYKDFKKIELSGYPAVVANRVKPVDNGMCAVFLASQENQVVGSAVTVPVDDVGQTNPCDIGKKALKLSLPSWPAAG
ncbi:DUF3558 domain-containing protein [Actinopolyspora erythraea]|uniref:DUF3558 domain-containing protein n=1 Tax=Actinopolyspora erythraea TaxID=414996 RepID=A0A223RMC9_9ACTN|nr:DUF3558 domain-containing protein [Actinopolyspora erythraea]ASU77029.1 DUF3558 domain-containing protein [Actinopolyspora erythraea]